jgi:hypothetical protein
MTPSCTAGEILTVTVFKVHHVNGQMEATNTILLCQNSYNFATIF